MSKPNTRQERCWPAQFQTREADGGALYIEGYFAVFNSPYVLWEGAEEVVKPGAFTETLGADDIRALNNHDSTLVIGRNKVHTLELKEDSHGLWGRIEINRKDTDAMNLHARVERGDIDQCSFGFYIEKEAFVDLGGGRCRWEIEKVKLLEVSPCTFPAYEATSISARKNELETINKRAVEVWRRDMKNKIGGKK